MCGVVLQAESKKQDKQAMRAETKKLNEELGDVLLTAQAKQKKEDNEKQMVQMKLQKKFDTATQRFFDAREKMYNATLQCGDLDNLVMKGDKYMLPVCTFVATKKIGKKKEVRLFLGLCTDVFTNHIPMSVDLL